MTSAIYFIAGALLGGFVMGLISKFNIDEQLERAYDSGRKDEKEEILNKIDAQYMTASVVDDK